MKFDYFLDNIVSPLVGILLLYAILVSTAKADENYGNFFSTQPKLEWVFDAALAADMMTTADIKNHPNLIETNPVLGEHPTDAAIIGYGLAAAGLHAAVTYEMVSQGVPKGIITAWEAVSIGVETGFAAHNYSLGLRFKF
jgi:hypothetical protein